MGTEKTFQSLLLLWMKFSVPPKSLHAPKERNFLPKSLTLINSSGHLKRWSLLLLKNDVKIKIIKVIKYSLWWFSICKKWEIWVFLTVILVFAPMQTGLEKITKSCKCDFQCLGCETLEHQEWRWEKEKQLWKRQGQSARIKQPKNHLKQQQNYVYSLNFP